MKPFISVITPTKNRHIFLKNMLRNFFRQDYPIDKMELLIGDDSDESIEEIIPQNENIRYFHLEKMTIGKKRNFLCNESKGDIIIFMDDDDYYPPDKVSHVVDNLWNSKYNVSGSSILHVYYICYDEIYKFGPYKYKDNDTNHATCGTISFKREYFKNNKFPDKPKAEEAIFLKNWKTKVLQLDSLKSILCIAHLDNTVDKHKYRSNGKLTKIKLTDLNMSDSDILFYNEILKLQHENEEKEK